MNTKLLVSFFAALVCAISTPAVQAAGSPSPEITFPAGAKAVAVKGRLQAKNSKAFYSLAAKKGDKLELRVASQASLVVLISFPDGTMDGGPGGIQTEVPKSGVCRIEIHSRHLESKGDFTLSVKKLP